MGWHFTFPSPEAAIFHHSSLHNTYARHWMLKKRGFWFSYSRLWTQETGDMLLELGIYSIQFCFFGKLFFLPMFGEEKRKNRW